MKHEIQEFKSIPTSSLFIFLFLLPVGLLLNYYKGSEFNALNDFAENEIQEQKFKAIPKAQNLRLTYMKTQTQGSRADLK